MELRWGGKGYSAYEVVMKVSSGENKAAGQQQQITQGLQTESQNLINMMNTQFAEQQGLLNNTLIPQLTQMATNPQGFGAQAMAAMRSQAIGTIGTQLASQLQQSQQQFATQDMAGLQSGVQQALRGQLGMQATGQEAGALQNLAIANAQAQMQQQQFGLQGLAGATQLLGEVPQSAGLGIQAAEGAGQSANAAFNQQYTMAQQGGFWSNLARGALGSPFLEGLVGMIPGVGPALSAGMGMVGGAMGGGQAGQAQAPMASPYGSITPGYANFPGAGGVYSPPPSMGTVLGGTPSTFPGGVLGTPVMPTMGI
jgi:hypothetical protein